MFIAVNNSIILSMKIKAFSLSSCLLIPNDLVIEDNLLTTFGYLSSYFKTYGNNIAFANPWGILYTALSACDMLCTNPNEVILNPIPANNSA